MENERTENIFYLDLKHVHKYGCAKFQPNPLFSSQQTATESAAEKNKTKKKKKVGNRLRGSRQQTGCPNKHCCDFFLVFKSRPKRDYYLSKLSVILLHCVNTCKAHSLMLYVM